ncbi:retrovirus-related pol polyprotein from transposon TNT 1-94 [Tanacetum coccineum]
MSFIKRVENQNDTKVKQLKTDNGTEFRNSIFVNFCDEKGISQNFSSPYTPEQNGVAERKNRTLIEAARTMLSGSVFSKQYWTKAVAKSSTLEDNKLKKPITSHLMKALRLSNFQNLQLTTSTLLKHKDIHLMNIFILMNLLKDQNDQFVQNDEILNDDHSEHSNHTNDGQIIDNIPNTKDIQISEHLSSPSVEDTLAQNTIPIPPPLLIPSVVTPVP